MRSKASSFPGDGLVGAVIVGRGLPGTIRADRVEFFHNASDALEAVNRGEIDFVYGLASYMEYEIQKNHFTNVVPVTLVNDRMDVSFALAKPADPELLTIINKAVNSISSDRRNELMDQNLISVGSGQLSLTELIYANPFMFIGVLTTLLLILVTSVLWFNRMRVKSYECRGRSGGAGRYDRRGTGKCP